MKYNKWLNDFYYLSFFTVFLMLSGCDGGLARNTDQASNTDQGSGPPSGQNTGNFGHHSSLADSVKANDMEAVKAFLAKGGDVNGTDANGYTHLHQASTVEMVQLLVEKGADFNEAGKNPVINGRLRAQNVPMYDHALNNRLDILRFLLSKGADPNKGQSPVLFAAIDADNEATVRLLAQHKADLSLKDNGLKLNALTYAVFKNKPAMVKLILSLDKTLINKGNPFPLEEAIESLKPDLDMVKLLVTSGADVNQDTPFLNENAFEMAITKDVAIASYLADQGSKVRPHAFWRIASNGQLDAVKLVFQKNPVITVEPEYLNAAIENGHQDVALALLKGDATLTGFSKHLKHSGLSLAVEKKMPAIVRAIILKYGAKGKNTSRLLGKYWTDDNILADLLVAGVDPNGVAKNGGPLLHYRALNSSSNIVGKAVELLVGAGANVNLPVRVVGGACYYNDTPLHLAAYAGNPALVEYLLAHGAQPSLAMLNDTASEGTPLHVVASRSNGVHGADADRFLETVRKLLAGGADKTKTNANGQTPWQIITVGNDKHAQYKLILQ